MIMISQQEPSLKLCNISESRSKCEGVEEKGLLKKGPPVL